MHQAQFELHTTLDKLRALKSAHAGNLHVEEWRRADLEGRALGLMAALLDDVPHGAHGAH